MIKFGQVTEYNKKTGMATVMYSRPEACEKCGACGKARHTGMIQLKADCKAGDWVRVELPDGRFLSAAALAYGLPLVLFLLGLALGYILSGRQEGAALIGGALGLGLALLALRLKERSITGRPEWTPRITEVYGSKPEIDDIGCDGHC